MEASKFKKMMTLCWLKLKWSSRMKSLITNLTTSLPKHHHPKLSKPLTLKNPNMLSKTRKKIHNLRMKSLNQPPNKFLLPTVSRQTKPNQSHSWKERPKPCNQQRSIGNLRAESTVGMVQVKLSSNNSKQLNGILSIQLNKLSQRPWLKLNKSWSKACLSFLITSLIVGTPRQQMTSRA